MAPRPQRPIADCGDRARASADRTLRHIGRSAGTVPASLGQWDGFYQSELYRPDTQLRPSPGVHDAAHPGPESNHRRTGQDPDALRGSATAACASPLSRRSTKHSLTVSSESMLNWEILHRPALMQKRVSRHVLRHTAALVTLQATKDLRKVSLWLGHANMQTTEIYTRVDPSVKLEVLESIMMLAPK